MRIPKKNITKIIVKITTLNTMISINKKSSLVASKRANKRPQKKSRPKQIMQKDSTNIQTNK